MGACLNGDLWEGGLSVFLVVGHIPVETFLLANYLFDGTNTGIRAFFKGQANFHFI